MSNNHLKNIKILNKSGISLGTLLNLTESQTTLLVKKLNESEKLEIQKQIVANLGDFETEDAQLRADLENAEDEQ